MAGVSGRHGRQLAARQAGRQAGGPFGRRRQADWRAMAAVVVGRRADMHLQPAAGQGGRELARTLLGQWVVVVVADGQADRAAAEQAT